MNKLIEEEEDLKIFKINNLNDFSVMISNLPILHKYYYNKLIFISELFIDENNIKYRLFGEYNFYENYKNIDSSWLNWNNLDNIKIYKLNEEKKVLEFYKKFDNYTYNKFDNSIFL